MLSNLTANHDADLFLLSWTLPQQGHITSTYLPNLIYVDFCDNFVTDVCNFIHATLMNE